MHDYVMKFSLSFWLWFKQSSLWEQFI